MPGFNLAAPERPVSRIAAISAVVIMLIVMFFAIIMYLRVSKTEASYKGKTKVCYLPNWTTVRTTPGANFTLDDLDFALCSHVCYAFLGLHETEYTITLLSPEVDSADNGGQGLIDKLVAKAAAADASVLISFGGWTQSGKEAYETLLSNTSLMEKFTASAVETIRKYKVQGLDLDYEYPGHPQGVAKAGSAGKAGFTKLITVLRAAFKPSGFLLTAAVSAGVDNVDKYYEPKALNENLDWVGLMTYDYSGGTDPVIGVTAPLDRVKASVEAWISKGVDPSKLILGVPFYSASYTLADKNKTTIGSAASGVGSAGRGLYYSEICYNIKHLNWTVSTETDYKYGTYAYKDNQWSGYDSVANMKTKGEYIVEKKLAGFMCWAIDQDDFSNTCGEGKYPLLTAISNALGK